MIHLLLLLLLFSTVSVGQIANVASNAKYQKEDGVTGGLEFNWNTMDGNIDVDMASAKVSARIQQYPNVGIVVYNRDLKTTRGRVFTDSYLAHLRLQRYIEIDFALELFFQQSKDIFRRLDQRDLAGFGPRYTVAPGLDVGLSLMAEWEEYTSVLLRRDIAPQYVNRLSVFFSYEFDINEYGTVEHVTYFQPALNDTNDRKIHSETGLKFRIADEIYYRIFVSSYRDSRPPDERLEKSDTSLENRIVFNMKL